MTHNDYLNPGIAAILAAVLFPTYWIYEVGVTMAADGLRQDLGAADLVYLLVGGLLIYVYTALKRILHDHNEYHGADLVLTLMIASCAFMYPFLLIASMTVNETTFSAIWIASFIIYGALDTLLAVILLRDSKELPDIIRWFAITNLILGIAELTIVFSFATLALYPVTALILAIHFLRKPDEIAIV
jgi:hypothetical protein